jgi:predicted chitinase
MVADPPSADPVADMSALDDAITRFKIDKRPRIATFLAQVGHESGQLPRWSKT